MISCSCLLGCPFGREWKEKKKERKKKNLHKVKKYKFGGFLFFKP